MDCGVGAMLHSEEDKCMEATKEDLGRGSIEEENQSVEARTEVGSLGSKGDGFGTNKDGLKAGRLLEEPILYALPYMKLQDILSIERVSKICRQWVKDDVSLWRQLHVEPPLSEKLTDEALLELAARSKGQLQCLSLVECLRITEGAVEHVVCSNPQLSKLCLPGCIWIHAKAVLRMVKKHSDHRFPGSSGLKQLRLRNIYGFTKEDLDILLIMLGGGNKAQCSGYKPQFYRHGNYAPSCDDQRPIDVEVCPKCSQVRSVYDCTREICQKGQRDKFQHCHGCIDCIGRCEECGKCEYDEVFEETFCSCLVCSACWLELPKCSECNRPGCGRHANHFITTFVCDDCCSPASNDPESHVQADFDL